MRHLPRGWRLPAYVAGAGAVMLGGYSASATSGVEIRVQRTNAPNVATRYAPQLRTEAGPQLVMVYFGAASCVASNQEGLPEIVETLKVRLADIARDGAHGFLAMGVALDWRSDEGTMHLARFGRFDQISAGYNWGNELGIKYMWADRSITPATPQVAVYRRVFTTPADSAGGSVYADRQLELVATATGVEGIREWMESDEGLESITRSLEERQRGEGAPASRREG